MNFDEVDLIGQLTVRHDVTRLDVADLDLVLSHLLDLSFKLGSDLG